MSRNAILLMCLVALVAPFAGCTTVDKNVATAEADWKGRYDFKMRTPVVLVAEPAARRAQVEGEIVRILRARGVQAVPSHTFVPNLDRIDVAAFKEAVIVNHYDSVIVVDPFAATEADQIRTTEVTEISGSNFVAVAERGWTTDQMRTDYGLLITVWEAATWKPVWIGETDTMVEVDSSPNATAVMVTTRVQSERLY